MVHNHLVIFYILSFDFIDGVGGGGAEMMIIFPHPPPLPLYSLFINKLQ